MARQSKQQSRRCWCCRLFWLFLLDDFSSHNQIYKILFAHSLFVSRTLRLLFLFLALHIELALCAFFYDLEGEHHSTLSYTSLVQTLWVGFYSALLTVPLMMSVSLCFRVKKKHERRLASALSVSQF